MLKKLTRHLLNRWTDRIVDKIAEKAKSGDHDPTALESESNGVITTNKHCLEIKSSKQKASIAWEDIHAIFSYKADLFSYDMICIAIGRSRDTPVLEATEEMHGFIALKAKLTELFPGFDQAYSKWLLSSPAFDTTPVLLWEKPNAL